MEGVKLASSHKSLEQCLAWGEHLANGDYFTVPPGCCSMPGMNQGQLWERSREENTFYEADSPFRGGSCPKVL